MTQNPEDELLDESLRETFSDFTLSPSSRLWAGVEEQLADIPKAPRALPYKVLLPLVGLVGVGVGWLLPHPESTKPTPKTEQPAVSRTEAPAAALQPAPTTVSPDILSAVAPNKLEAGREQAATTAEKRMAARRPQLTGVETKRITAAQTPETDTLVLAASAALPLAALPPAADTLTATALPAPAAVSADSQLSAAPVQLSASEVRENERTGTAGTGAATRAAAAGVLKPGEAPREWRTEYRVPTHRMAEKGRGFRRRITHLTQQVRHVFSPRRSKAAAQPDF
ncbi:hypothetical protein KBK19_04200 [Microvirga sp. STR05]|uniref:Uncharacterized protein n=1 Tax=Hymenobacter duratus TaxID=2771356 RepID=A0ABR8JC45_9BACT|nr:hypothetical protein [Hymenobacter duratus]MBD2714233.1 hypothetical protein [Hymenobacter duratus]MBR7949135.1 hypothetical protein [Microvirga sp. STR05]